MSKIVASTVMNGAIKLFDKVNNKCNELIALKGKDCATVFPNTAYYAPFIFALTGVKIQKALDIEKFLDYIKHLLHPTPLDVNWLPYLGNALDCGIATLMLEELLMLMKYTSGEEPQKGYEGFLSDTQMRTLGVQLVDGRMPGFAAIIGACENSKTAVKIVQIIAGEKHLNIFKR